jgi:hypothetical protein
VVRLVWSNDPESYAGGSVATGRASHASHVDSDDPDRKGYPGPSGWGWGMRLKLIQKFCHAAKSEIQFRISSTINQNILNRFYLVKKSFVFYGTQGIFIATDKVLYINV